MNRLEKLKLLEWEDLTKDDKQYLRDKGIINGVGAEWQGRFVRWILTGLFCFLDYERHDFYTWKGGTIQDFHRSNWGLLKYSCISIAQDYRELHFCYKWSKLWRTPIFILWAMIRIALIIYAYRICESKIGQKAFDFHE